MKDELIPEAELTATLEEILKDQETMEVFDLDKKTCKELLKVRVTGTGFNLSPNFRSAGWGENTSDSLQINLSVVGNDRGVIKHEFKHAMHTLVCARLFRSRNVISHFNSFVENVFKDPGFYEWRDKYTGLIADNQWEKIQALIDLEGDLTQTDIAENAMLLGSVVYQHAYFVDPIMCEAVASTNDSGFAQMSGKLNRLVGKMIPGDQVIEGYGWKQAQIAFGKASLEKKALLVKKSEYSRNKFFNF